MKKLRILGVLLASIAAVFFSIPTDAATEFFTGIKSMAADGHEAVYATVVTSPIIALQNYQGTYEKKLFSTAMNEMEVLQDIDFLTRVKSKRQMTKLTVGNGARPYAGGKEQLEGEDLKYTGTTLEVELFQRDYSVEIKRYYEQWLEQELRPAEGSSSQQKTLPFAAYTTNEITKSLKAELNDKTAYHGFNKADAVAYDAGDTYAVGDYITFVEGEVTNYYECLAITTAGQSPTTTAAKWKKVNAEAICPGIGYRLQEQITAATIVPVTIGEIDNSSVFAYAAHTELFRSHTDAHKKMGATHFCSWDQFFLLLDDIEDKVAKYTEKDSVWVNGRGIYLPKTNRKCLILPCSWMSDTERIISTPGMNLKGGTDLTSDMNTMKTREATNYISVTSITGTMGFCIQDPLAVRCNDRV